MQKITVKRFKEVQKIIEFIKANNYEFGFFNKEWNKVTKKKK